MWYSVLSLHKNSKNLFVGLLIVVANEQDSTVIYDVDQVFLRLTRTTAAATMPINARNGDNMANLFAVNNSPPT